MAYAATASRLVVRALILVVVFAATVCSVGSDGRQEWFGFYRAVVTDVFDPIGRGRVRVSIPALGSDLQIWAIVLTPVVGGRLGPGSSTEVGRQVVVGFEAGDPASPFVVGAVADEMVSSPVRLETR